VTIGLTDAAEGLSGDYNRNQSVDAADYVIWRKTLGQVGSDLSADGDEDGTVDLDDHKVWTTNFGAASAEGSATSSLIADSSAITSDALQSASATGDFTASATLQDAPAPAGSRAAIEGNQLSSTSTSGNLLLASIARLRDMAVADFAGGDELWEQDGSEAKDTPPYEAVVDELLEDETFQLISAT
jgi:hypothetical protein